MTTRTMSERRNRLSYLALYYAIQGDERRSEKVRRMIRRLDTTKAMPQLALSDAPVTA